MTLFALPAVYAVLLWWVSTGVILYLDGLPRPTHRWSMLAVAAAAAGSIAALALSAGETSTSGAFVAFTAAVLAWALPETAFLMGFVTGSRRVALPAGSKGWRRFRYAVQSIDHHEAMIALTALAVWAATAGGANTVGLSTFLILWVMRLSAKLNIFLGVPNVAEAFLPAHLDYLKSYFRKRSMNLLFPLSVSASTAVAALLFSGAAAAPHPAATTAAMLLGSLLTLAILEHLLMVTPLPSERLWNWGFRSRQIAATPAPDAARANPFGRP